MPAGETLVVGRTATVEVLPARHGSTRMTLRRSAALIGTGLLAACSTVGPDYHRPATAVIDRPSATAPFAGGNEAAFAALQPVPTDGGSCIRTRRSTVW